MGAAEPAGGGCSEPGRAPQDPVVRRRLVSKLSLTRTHCLPPNQHRQTLALGTRAVVTWALVALGVGTRQRAVCKDRRPQTRTQTRST